MAIQGIQSSQNTPEKGGKKLEDSHLLISKFAPGIYDQLIFDNRAKTIQ